MSLKQGIQEEFNGNRQQRSEVESETYTAIQESNDKLEDNDKVHIKKERKDRIAMKEAACD